MSIPRPVRWLAGKARPRNAGELLVLTLVVLAILTFMAQAVSAGLKGHSPGIGLVWSAALLSGAIAARSARWWRAEFDAMTRDRLRLYVACMLLLGAAVSLSWHLFSDSLGWGGAYLLLGPMSRPPSAPVILATIGMIALALILRVPVGTWLVSGMTTLKGSVEDAQRRKTLRADSVQDMIALAPVDDFEDDLLGHESEVRTMSAVAVPIGAKTSAGQVAIPFQRTSESVGMSVIPAPPLPPIETFKPAPKVTSAPTDLEHKAHRIQETLASFGVAARVVGHHAGPAVTQFDVQPDRGTKVKSITALQNDLALALAAQTIRIQAPVPGKSVVGIEIPNSSATTVSLRELLESEAYTKLTSPLAIALGKDVTGNPAVIDLAKMPHLLIAGATGSGKSVCVNTLISCLLYRNTPEEVRLMLVDPKRVELPVYNGVPHLLSPVITDMDKVVGVLQWALREMDRRYMLFSESTVRNIARYNEKIALSGGRKLPYIVFIIDELADLMMVSPEDVEEAICRLAQLARAAGIHLVIATQRPSVDVVTGLIKANFPARIAFNMTSQIDSRTILDTAGAEKLLGRGDMLYQPPDAPKPARLQGAFLSDNEIEKLVEFWKRSPLQATIQAVPATELVAVEKTAAESGDDLLDEATRTVRKFQTASVSLLQRHLKVGYARAARIMDQLEERGVVGPADGNKQRPVLIDAEEQST